MPLYSIKGPDGKVYEIEGPEGATREQVIRAIQARMETQPTASYDPAEDIVKVGEAMQRTSPEESGFIENVMSGIGVGAVNTFELGALGGAALLEEESELKVRDKIQSAAKAVRPEGGDPDSMTYKISSGLGSIAGAMGATAAAVYGAGALGLGTVGAGVTGLITGTAIGVGAGAGEASERARKAGATEEERNTATLQGAAVGLTEMLPIGRIMRLPGLSRLVRKVDGKDGTNDVLTGVQRIRNAAATGSLEATQEMTAAFLQNLIERGYNPEKELLDAGIIDEGIAGGGAGAIMQALVDFLTTGKRAKVVTDTPEPEDISGETWTPRSSLAPSTKLVEEDTNEVVADVATPDDIFAAIDRIVNRGVPQQSITEEMVFDEIAVMQEEVKQRADDKETAEIEALLAEDERKAAEERRAAEQAAALEAKRLEDEREAAELEAMLAEEEQRRKEEDQLRVESDIESVGAKVAGEQQASAEATRLKILQGIIESTPTTSYTKLVKNFKQALEEAGVSSLDVTTSEMFAIEKAVNMQIALNRQPQTLTSRRAQTDSSPIVTSELLDSLGISPRSSLYTVLLTNTLILLKSLKPLRNL